MRLLIITQATDLDTPVLGFFHRWIEEFAGHTERVLVLCLFEGRHHLPDNVSVHSLGKEAGKGRCTYLWQFFRFIVLRRKEYDAVFVHMNAEYVLLGGPLWLAMRKPVCLWRNHYQKSLRALMAARMCRYVFSTSRFSYAASFPNARIMPVGVATDLFASSVSETRIPRSILFLARMAPSKKVHVVLEALAVLQSLNVAFSATLVGSPAAGDEEYYQKLQEQAMQSGLAACVVFAPAVPHAQTPPLYGRHEFFVNASPSGMFDKTLFEAMSAGALVVAANKDLEGALDARLLFEEDDAMSLARTLKRALALSDKEKAALRHEARALAEAHSLGTLIPAIVKAYA